MGRAIEAAPPSSSGRTVSEDTRQRLRERLDAYMAKKKLRSTSQRRLIVDTFFGGSPHMTIEDLLAEVRFKRGDHAGDGVRGDQGIAICGALSGGRR